MKKLHKICDVYVTPPNDIRVIESLKDEDIYIAEDYDTNGKYKITLYELINDDYYA